MAKKKRSSTGGTPATVELDRAGVPYAVHPYDHDPGAASYGHEAAVALGVPPGRVFKTLLADVDDALVVAVVPVSGTLNLKALARAAGGKRAVMAESAVAERSTGYVVGGISPLGQRKRLTTVIDQTALAHDTVYISGGRRGLDLELQPQLLVDLTEATLAPIGRGIELRRLNG